MKETEIIILVASFICGAFGSLFAKQAKKKSSYTLLYISTALAVLTFIGIVAAVIFVFFDK
ncbi:MAG: hypothetical protein E7482_01135 [Ruminococcaceae bacterium]|nr:hypothetical protein [Oscillospiraceae bacterium]